MREKRGGEFDAWLNAERERDLLECFVPGVPTYHLRFRGPASLAANELFLLVRQVMALQEECAEAFEGCVRCDETMFGGYPAGKVIVFSIYPRNGQVFAVNNRKRADLL